MSTLAGFKRPHMLSDLGKVRFDCEMTQPNTPYNAKIMHKFAAQGRTKNDLEKVGEMLDKAELVRINIRMLQNDFQNGAQELMRRKLERTDEGDCQWFHGFYTHILKAWTLPAMYKIDNPDASQIYRNLIKAEDEDVGKELLLQIFNFADVKFQAAIDDLKDAWEVLLPIRSLFKSSEIAAQYFEKFGIKERFAMVNQLVRYHQSKYNYARWCIEQTLGRADNVSKLNRLEEKFEDRAEGPKHPLGR